MAGFFRRTAALLAGVCLLAGAFHTAFGEAPAPSSGYVYIWSPTVSGWLALPEEGDVTYPLVQNRIDGTLTVNLIHLTPEGVYMESSTCDNQDCVEEGMVTLENKETRALMNMIICLPNQVYVQLFTPEEVLAMTAPSDEHTATDTDLTH